LSETVGTNVEYEVTKNILTVKVDLTKEFGPSASGKTIKIASSQGNVKINGTDAIMGLNVYKKP